MGLGLNIQHTFCSNLSSGTISMTGDPDTLITDNGDGTININHGGEFRIVDRTDTFNFISRSRLRSWVATNNIDHIASGTDGSKVIIVDINSVITIVALPSGSGKLLANEGAGVPNFNTHLQLGSIVKDAGSIDSFLFFVGINNNIHNRVRFLLDTTNVINSINSPQDIVISGNNDLKLKYTKGSALLTDIGFIKTDGLNLDEDILSADLPDVFLVSVTRDGIIQSFSTDLDVLNIESSVGNLTPMSNNTAANRYLLGFADEQFAVILFGKTDFGGGAALQDAADAIEDLDNIALTQAGVKLRKISVIKSETDNANFILNLLKQYR